MNALANPTSMAQPAQPQPNFQVLNNAITQASQELNNFQNLPQIANAGAILNQLQQLNHNLGQVEARLRRLMNRMRASTRNDIARFQNSTRNMAISPLVPLVQAATGDPIANFPATIGVIDGMTGVEVRDILTALDEPITGTVAVCRTRLKYAIGLVVQAL